MRLTDHEKTLSESLQCVPQQSPTIHAEYKYYLCMLAWDLYLKFTHHINYHNKHIIILDLLLHFIITIIFFINITTIIIMTLMVGLVTCAPMTASKCTLLQL